MTAWQPVPEVRPTRTHKCPRREEIIRSSTGSPSPAPREWGESITAVVELEGIWWSVSRDPPEYSTPIEYCPWCGIELKGLI
jgi:hypothetical protein